MMPGVTNLPVRSTTFAPGGAGRPGPMAVMLPFWIMMVASRSGAAPVPSMTVARVRAVTEVCALTPPAATTAAPTNNAPTRMSSVRMCRPP
jgi:hypothetical protein